MVTSDMKRLYIDSYKVGRMEQVETSEQAKAKRGPGAVSFLCQYFLQKQTICLVWNLVFNAPLNVDLVCSRWYNENSCMF